MKITNLEPYTLPAQRSDWDELLVDWTNLIPSGATPWLLSRFGELFMEHPNGRIGMLQVSAFQYQEVAKSRDDFEEWLVDPEKIQTWFLTPLVDRLVGAGRLLKPDWCYSFTTPLGLGGSFDVQNVAMLPIREHFGCWGEVFRQIRDLPDGSSVMIRVKN